MGALCSNLCNQSSNGHESNHYFEAWRSRDKENESIRSNSFRELEVPTRSYENIRSVYALDNTEHQEGTFGKVVKARLREEFTQMYAVKVIRKKDEFKDSLAMREIELLRKMDHPNIVKFKEVYEDYAFFYIVLEYLSGGDLQQQLEVSHTYSESLTKEYIWQIMLATNYLHQLQIVHGDLKPENFVIEKEGSSTIKMIDFGLSDILKNRAYLSQLSGSRFYIAPEVLRGQYTEKRDLWSIGVMLYLFMTGKLAFDADSEVELFDSIKRGHFDIATLEETNCTKNLIDLCKGLLEMDPDRRLSAKDAIFHPWFADKRAEVLEKGKQLLTIEILQNIRKFSMSSFMKREMMALLIQSFNDEESNSRNSKVFFAADQDFSGLIDSWELNELFLRKGIILEYGELDTIMRSMDVRNKSYITFQEFMIATVSRDQLEKPSRLKMLFKALDTNKDGSVGYSDLNNCFARYGRCMPRDKIESMITEADINDDRQISYAEFVNIMKA